jgi:hypothetical protein
MSLGKVSNCDLPTHIRIRSRLSTGKWTDWCYTCLSDLLAEGEDWMPKVESPESTTYMSSDDDL